jgi:23S rRNA pseudouridine1911/1915/1917 synthase
MLEELLQFETQEAEAGQTVREVLQKNYGVSRRLLVNAKYKGEIRVNGRPVYVTYRLQPGDRVTVFVPLEVEQLLQPEPMELAIRHEDEDILVIAKPAGMVVHPTGNHASGTLANGVIAYWQAKGQLRKFRPVNRLDKDTSGLLIVAKNQWAHEQFSRMQKERTLKRVYQAVVHGVIERDEGVIDAPIGRCDDSIITREVREDGQPARTLYRVLARGETASWVELHLETGRTHQIRVHLSYLGHPLLGDDLYGGKRDHIGRQALHAVRLSFVHPRTKRPMAIAEPLPEDMGRLLETLIGKGKK